MKNRILNILTFLSFIFLIVVFIGAKPSGVPQLKSLWIGDRTQSSTNTVGDNDLFVYGDSEFNGEVLMAGGITIGNAQSLSIYSGNLTTAATTIGHNDATTLIIDTAPLLTADTDISSYTNIDFLWLAGNEADTTGYTLTLYKPSNILAAPGIVCFTGTGRVIFSLAGILNVDNYNIKPGSSSYASMNTASLASLIAYAPEGCTFKFQPQTYYFNDGFLVENKFYWQGAGSPGRHNTSDDHEGTQLVWTADLDDEPGIYISGTYAQGWIRDMTLDLLNQESSTTSYTSAAGVRIADSKGFQIKNCVIKRPFGHAIYCTSANNIKIIENDIRGRAGWGYIDDATAWVTSTEYVIEDMVIESGTYYECLENHTSGVFADDLAAGKWEEYTDITGAYGIMVASDSQVIDNQFHYFSTGILLAGDNNLISQNRTDFNLINGIQTASTADRNIISNNICDQNGQAGIYINGSGNIIEGNQCYNNGRDTAISNAYRAGIFVNSNATTFSILSNNCTQKYSSVVDSGRDDSEYGIYVDDDATGIVRNNIAFNNDTAQIRIANTNDQSNIQGESVSIPIADIAAGTDDSVPLFLVRGVPNGILVYGTYMLNATSIPQNFTDYTTYSIRQRDTDGTALGTISTTDSYTTAIVEMTQTAIGGAIGYTYKNLTAGQSISIYKQDSGAGQATDKMVIGIDYVTY